MTEVRSIYGTAIAEIQMQWSLRRIARHVGCDVATVCMIKDDPRWTPNYRLAEAILELRDNLQTGRSRWGRIIIALRTHAFSTAQIAQLCGVGDQAILKLEANPDVIPQHDTAVKLLELYRRHVTSRV